MTYQATAGAEPKGRPIRTSELLREFGRSLTAERISVGEIVSGLGDRGLGVLIAILALPNVLPATVPFGNVLTGIPPLICAIQLVLGFERLMLPGFISRRTVSAKTLKSLMPRLAGLLSWFERLLTPRLTWVTGVHAERVFGVICILLSFVSMLPIPFGHNLPALGLVLMGLGLIERDGLAILIGAALGIAGSIILALVLLGLAQGVGFLIHDFGLG